MSYVNILQILVPKLKKVSKSLISIEIHYQGLYRGYIIILFLLNTKCTTKHSLEQFFKSDIDHRISHHRHFKSYLCNYERDFDH